MTIELKGGHETTDPRLDRLPEFDERSRNFPISAVVPEEIKRGRTWYQRTWLDQGREGACVSFAWHHDATASPVVVKGITNEIAKSRYWDMQKIDEWAGGSYPGASPFYEGTSVLAGAKIMRDLGFMDEFRWSFSIEEWMRGIVNEGPNIFGLPWLDSMFKPRPSGLLDCSGKVAGGHAIQGRGLSLKPTLTGEPSASQLGPVARLHNSWGPNWGIRGDAYIKLDDLERLLKMSGESCFPINRRNPDS